MHNFEDKLLGELRAVVAERPEPATVRGARRAALRIPVLRLAGVMGIAAVASVMGIAVWSSGDAAPSAYAVERHDDGSVTVTINSLKDADGLQAKLRAAGIPAIVDYDASGSRTCAPPDGATGPQVHTQERMEPGNVAVGGASGRPGSAPEGERPVGPVGDRLIITKGAIMKREGNDGNELPPVGASGIRVTADGAATFTLQRDMAKPGQHVYITTSDGELTSINMAIGETRPEIVCPPVQG